MTSVRVFIISGTFWVFLAAVDMVCVNKHCCGSIFTSQTFTPDHHHCKGEVRDEKKQTKKQNMFCWDFYTTLYPEL